MTQGHDKFSKRITIDNVLRQVNCASLSLSEFFDIFIIKQISQSRVVLFLTVCHLL